MTTAYMQWAKTRSDGKFNLATSGVSECSFEDLQVTVDGFELRRPSGYTYEPLQQALSARCEVPAESIVTALGTSFANHLVLASLLSPGDEILVEDPAYDPLIAVANYLRAKIKRFHRRFEDGFQIDPVEVEKLATSQTKLIILTNLHNPTSAYTGEQTLTQLQRIARRVGARILVDEVYLELLKVAGRPMRSAFSLGADFIVTSSLTKAYGLSGLRCGWIVAEPAVADRLWQLHDLYYSTPPHITERLSVTALQDLDRLAKRAEAILRTNRALLTRFLDSNVEHLEVVRSDVGTVVFPRLRNGRCELFCELLRNKYETTVVPGAFFGMPDCFRLGIGGSTNLLSAGLERVAAALDEFSRS